MITINVNGNEHALDVDDDTPLLWAIRDVIGLTGSKFGCGKGLCGACTMHLNGEAIRSCITPVSAVVGKEITTIEVIAETEVGQRIQQAWIALDVPQCGYCQSGQIMTATALLSKKKQPSDNEIDNAMSGNICRCGTYPRIKNGIKMAAGIATNSDQEK
jgi:isoquinoline 1-oxidoreductase alpha subunit